MPKFSPAYILYMRSATWQATRKRALKRAGNQCQICGDSYKLQVHHIHYRNLGYEQPADLNARRVIGGQRG